MRLTLLALGLKDCYVDRKIGQNVSIVMSNADSPIGSDMFGSIAVDWCAGSGRGFTESSDRRRKTIMNLLMHGCADEYSSNGRDMRGFVLGRSRYPPKRSGVAEGELNAGCGTLLGVADCTGLDPEAVYVYGERDEGRARRPPQRASTVARNKAACWKAKTGRSLGHWI